MGSICELHEYPCFAPKTDVLAQWFFLKRGGHLPWGRQSISRGARALMRFATRRVWSI